MLLLLSLVACTELPPQDPPDRRGAAVVIPAGWTTTGCTGLLARRDLGFWLLFGCLHNTPPRRTWIYAFEIQRYEVTLADYQGCVAAGGCRPLHPNNQPNGPDHPVLVPYDDAQAYCASIGRRLPSFAEWEKAARGTDGRLFPWGDQGPSAERGRFVVDSAVPVRNCDRGTGPVGQHPQGVSPYGLHDTYGNASEWTSDYDWVPQVVPAQTDGPASRATARFVFDGNRYHVDWDSVRSWWISPEPAILDPHLTASNRHPHGVRPDPAAYHRVVDGLWDPGFTAAGRDNSGIRVGTTSTGKPIRERAAGIRCARRVDGPTPPLEAFQPRPTYSSQTYVPPFREVGFEPTVVKGVVVTGADEFDENGQPLQPLVDSSGHAIVPVVRPRGRCYI